MSTSLPILPLFQDDYIRKDNTDVAVLKVTGTRLTAAKSAPRPVRDPVVLSDPLPTPDSATKGDERGALGSDCNCRVCQGLVLLGNAGTVAASVAPAPLGSTVDLGRTFFLHSNPTATKTIFLDFDGHVTTRTNWNNKHHRDLITKAFDIDGNAAVFSDAELTRIQRIWQRVAEDFAPFGIDVTTQDPGYEALTNTGADDTRWGTRVAIGGSYKDWYGASAGGVAYVGTFGWSAYGPSFVFSDNLGKGNEKYTAEAISHEAGHTLGLWHDGTFTSSYYRGHGTWAPIMGSGYYKGLTQWSQGEYASATNAQDDVAIIASVRNGAGFRPDDHGNSAATARALVGPSLSQFGTIETRDDTDWFSFTTGGGRVSLSVANATQAWVNDELTNYVPTVLAGRSPNLDIAATLFNGAGVQVASSNPLNGLAASLNPTLAAGTYFLRVDGVGRGDPLTTGYSDYGSLGQYLVTGSVV